MVIWLLTDMSLRNPFRRSGPLAFPCRPSVGAAIRPNVTSDSGCICASTSTHSNPRGRNANLPVARDKAPRSTCVTSPTAVMMAALEPLRVAVPLSVPFKKSFGAIAFIRPVCNGSIRV